MTTVVAGPEGRLVAAHRTATTVLLHLALGEPALLGYLLLLPVTDALGLPSAAALAAAGLLVVPAVQLAARDYHSCAYSAGWRSSSSWPAPRSC